MKIQDYYKTNKEIIALDYDFVMHFIPISEMYRFLIENHLLDYDMVVDGKHHKGSMTFDEWFKEEDVCSIDLANFIIKHYLNKQS